MGGLRWVWRGLLGCSLGACSLFDEGGDTHQEAAARATAEGLIAFVDINNNLTTDAEAAGAAVQKFLATPVAARDLVSPPFDFSDGVTLETMRTVTDSALLPTELPACVTTMGPGGCDSFAAAECEVGSLTFGGTGSRTCPGCPDQPDVFGACDYAWDMNVSIDAGLFRLDIRNTTGTETVSANEINANVRFKYDLITDDVTQRDQDIEVCACGPLTTDEGPPRTLVAGEFLVRTLRGESTTGCSVITFSNNVPSGSECTGEAEGEDFTSCPNGACLRGQ